jgi:hypothetical protein
VLVPLGAIALEFVLWPLGVRLPNWIQAPLDVSVAAVLYFGVPYIVLMGSLLWALKAASMAAHVWAAVLAPVLMAAVATPAFLWVLGIRGVEFWDSWRFYGTFCLGVGFTYVACALCLLWIGLKVGFLRRTA